MEYKRGIRALYGRIVQFAKANGYKKIQLSAIGVVNKDLEQKLISNGFRKTTVMVGDEAVETYTKTIEVK